MHKAKRVQKGFTLLEILLVIAAIGILSAIVLVAINPTRQISQVRNAERKAEINSIYKGLEQYLIETGSYPIGITDTPKEVCNTGNQTTTDTLSPTNLCDGKVDLRGLVPNYIAAIPADPGVINYRVNRNSANNRISVTAPSSELGQIIAINLSPPDFTPSNTMWWDPDITDDGMGASSNTVTILGINTTITLNVLVDDFDDTNDWRIYKNGSILISGSEDNVYSGGVNLDVVNGDSIYFWSKSRYYFGTIQFIISNLSDGDSLLDTFLIQKNIIP